MLLVILGLMGAVFLVYGQTLDFAFVTFDDGAYVADNWNVRQGLTPGMVRWAFTTYSAANWHPLTWLSLLWDYDLYGLNAGGYHLTNMLLHAMVTVGAFLWLHSASGAFWRPAFVAGLFALHPLHVESVAWVAERKDVLSAVFFVATLAAYTRWARRGGTGNYLLVVGLYVLGLMAKPMLVTVPAVLLLVDGWPLGRLGACDRWTLWLRFREKIPLFALTLISCVATFVAQRAGGAVVSLQRLTLPQRFANAVLGYGDYLYLTVVPARLSIFYPAREQWSIMAVVATLVLLAALTFAAWRWRQTAPALLMGWCWFLGMMVPVIGLVQVGTQSMADRYTYLPHLGLFIAFTWGMAALAAKLRVGPPGRLVLAGGALAILLACGLRAWQRTSAWENSFTLYRESLETTGPNLSVYQLLTDAALEDHHHREAERWLAKILKLAPGDVHAVMELGTLRLLQGRCEEAARLLGATLALYPNNAANFNNYGLALLRAGGHDDLAAGAFEQSLRIQPSGAPAHYNLGEIAQRRNDAAQALDHYERALIARPEWPEVLLRMAFLRATSTHPKVRDGRWALAAVERAVVLLGGNTSASLDCFAAACAELGCWPEAINAGETALEVGKDESGNPEAAQRRREWLECYRSGQPLRL